MSQLSAEQFDVVIVYEGLMAEGASDTSYRGRTPFSRTGEYFSYNQSYEYFLKYCKKLGIQAAFASTVDITSHGLFTDVWVYEKKWKRLHQRVDAKIVFDKFSNMDTFNKKYDLKLKKNAHGVHYFHNPLIRAIFDNKLKTYTTFSKMAIPTTQIDVQSRSTIAQSIQALRTQIRTHKHADDFEKSFVLKDQYGAGGMHVYKVKKVAELLKIGVQDALVSYILQPFIMADGFRFKQHPGSIDLRVIICNGIITDCYIRIIKKGEFRANASCGGEVEYIDTKKIPRDVLKMTKRINSMLPVQDGFYALDFMKSSAGHLYLIEGNMTPGLTWFNATDKRQVKRFMREMIDKIQVMAAAV